MPPEKSIFAQFPVVITLKKQSKVHVEASRSQNTNTKYKKTTQLLYMQTRLSIYSSFIHSFNPPIPSKISTSTPTCCAVSIRRYICMCTGTIQSATTVFLECPEFACCCALENLHNHRPHSSTCPAPLTTTLTVPHDTTTTRTTFRPGKLA